MKLITSKKSIDIIVNHEIGSPAYYNKRLRTPVWPGGSSGVTIGIGYDLGYNSPEQIKKDWGHVLSEADIKTLIKCSGLKGAPAKSQLNNDKALKSVIVTLESAKKVFYESALPRYARMTAAIYPGLDELKPDAIGALISMVYNRGASLAGASRKEMRNIVEHVKNKDYAKIAYEIDASKRLWEGKNLNGLITRRKEEAKMVKESLRQYTKEELIAIEI